MSLVEVTGREERDLIPITASIPVDSAHLCGWAAQVSLEKLYIGLADERFIRGGACEGKSFSSPVFELFDLLFPPPPSYFLRALFCSSRGETTRGGRKGREKRGGRRYHGNATIVRRKSLMRSRSTILFPTARSATKKRFDLDRRRRKGWSNERSRESKFDL